MISPEEFDAIMSELENKFGATLPRQKVSGENGKIDDGKPVHLAPNTSAPPINADPQITALDTDTTRGRVSVRSVASAPIAAESCTDINEGSYP